MGTAKYLRVGRWSWRAVGFMAAGLLLLLTACGGPGATTPRIARIDVTPGALLFTRAGETRTLTAQAFDSQGDPLDATFRWTSSDPSAVQVGDDGSLSTAADLGSALITASADGVDSFPASVVVAQPVAGAVLLTDDQIVAGPTPVDGTSDPIEQHVTLDGVTGVTAGSILLGAEAIGVGGKVVAATPSGGKLEVVYDPLPPQELFDRLDLEQDYDLSAAVPVPAGALAPSAKVHRGADGAFVLDLGATAGPAPLATTCEGEASFITISGLQSTLENDLRFYLHERTDAGDPKAAGAYVHGKLVQKVSGSLKVDAGFNGTYTCKKTLWEVPIPVSGVASILARPELPIGVAVSGSGSLTLAGATLGVEGSAGLNVKAGFTWDDSGDVTLLHAVDPIVEPPSITADLVTPPDFRVGLGAFTGLSSGVDLKVAGIGDVNIVQAQLGPKQSLDLAGLNAQASDTHYASSYDLTGVASVAIGTDLSKLISWLKLPVTLQALQVQETLPISHSPTGSVAVSTTSAAPGDTVHVHVALDPDHVTYLGHYNVRRVLVYAFEDGQDPALVGTIELSASNQTSFDTDWDTSGLPAGDYHVVAFVVDDLLARIHELPLEVSADPKQTVHLGNVCAASAGRVRAQNACSGSASWSEVQDPTANGVGIDVHTSSSAYTFVQDPNDPNVFHITAATVSWTDRADYYSGETLTCSITSSGDDVTVSTTDPNAGTYVSGALIYYPNGGNGIAPGSYTGGGNIVIADGAHDGCHGTTYDESVPLFSPGFAGDGQGMRKAQSDGSGGTLFAGSATFTSDLTGAVSTSTWSFDFTDLPSP